jgi:hypothetical protein
MKQLEFLVREAFYNSPKTNSYYYIMEPVEIAYELVDEQRNISEYVLNKNGDIDSDKFETLTITIQKIIEGD